MNWWGATVRRSIIREAQACILAARWHARGRRVRARSSPPLLVFPSFPTFVRLTWPRAARGLRWFPFSITPSFATGGIGRIVQNIGGIGNLTAIPPRATPDEVLAFDTGPGNMVIDAVAERLFDRPYDGNGRLAAKGEAIESVVRQLLRRAYFRQKPPKTAGREQFGKSYAWELLRLCRRADRHDVIATATALTARSIGIAVRDIVLPMDAPNHTASARWPSRYRQFVVSGGGTRNATLMRMIREELAPLKIQVRTSDDFGMPSEAKEAVAFALLAYQTWRRVAVEHSFGHWSRTSGNPRQDQLCVARSIRKACRVIPSAVEEPLSPPDSCSPLSFSCSPPHARKSPIPTRWS